VVERYVALGGGVEGAPNSKDEQKLCIGTGHDEVVDHTVELVGRFQEPFEQIWVAARDIHGQHRHKNIDSRGEFTFSAKIAGIEQDARG
jgi:hypothetical protein